MIDIALLRRGTCHQAAQDGSENIEVDVASTSALMRQAADEIERLARDLTSAIATAERNWEMIRRKDDAIGVLFDRLAKAGVDCSDLIS